MGKPFCKFLERKGEKVIHLDIKRDKKEDARITKLDLKNIDRIYFLAWDVGGAKYLYDENVQLSQLKWNLALMKNVFDQIESQNRDFLFISSQLAGQAETVYGMTKKLGEMWTCLLRGISVRLWNVYGELEEPHLKSHVLSDFVNQAISAGEIKMLTTGEEWRQFVHVDDVCNAFSLALSHKNLQRSFYDVTSYEWIKVKDAAQMICDLTGAILIPGTAIGRDQLDSPHMGRLPGWLPQVSLEDGLSRMITQAKLKRK